MTWAAGWMLLPGWPAGLVLPPLTAPWWGWPGWRDADVARLESPGQAGQDQPSAPARGGW